MGRAQMSQDPVGNYAIDMLDCNPLDAELFVFSIFLIFLCLFSNTEILNSSKLLLC